MILFLDDDVAFLDPYREELEERGYTVHVASSTDDAFRTVQERDEVLEAVILDMMMPPGRLFEGVETDMGLRTGELFYRKLRSLQPTVPIVLFTNRNTDHLDGDFRGDPLCKLFMKEELLPGEFADMITALRETTPTSGEKGKPS